MKKVYVTIKDIVNKMNHPTLNSYKKARDRYKLCLYLLPDHYSHDHYYSYLFKDNGMSESTLRMLINGNRKSHSTYIDYLAHNEFTSDLIQLLNNDMSARHSLFNNLYKLVSTNDYHEHHPLFHEIKLKSDEPYGKGYECYNEMVKIIAALLKRHTYEATT